MANRDVSDWPSDLQEALAPGKAPFLDELTAKAQAKFMDQDFDKAHPWSNALAYVISELVGGLGSADVGRALAELDALGPGALPLYRELIDIFSVPESASDMLRDILQATITVRARLDPEVEATDISVNELERRHYRVRPRPNSMRSLPTFDYILSLYAEQAASRAQ